MIDALEQAEAAVAACFDAATWAASEHDLVVALDAAHRLEQRVAAVKLALVREVDGRGIAAAQGASSTVVWLRERLRLDGGAARRLVGLAASVDAAPCGVRAALAGGSVTVEQARVIAETVETVQAAAGVEVADKAVGVLLDWAGQFDATLLRRMGARILDHVAPEVADAAAEAALRAQEARAARDRQVTVSEQSDGRLRLSGILDAEAAAVLRAAIDPLTAPAGPDDTRSPGQRRHDALADICRLALRTGDLPENGGDPAQIVVTTNYDSLTRQLGAGALDTGPHLTPDTVRRLACDAAVLPAILDGTGQPLDLGRQRRLITGPLRRALILRDRGCAFPGCDRPPRWCDAHHIHHWADGGPTTLTNAVLLCGHHHRHLHHTDWNVRLTADGHPEFIPPTWLDPTHIPRRNHYHRRT
ncbi:HNH endonuclease signature motif containing protein [Micromonospora profundi]|uniref:HNH endonuclease signature motif containing protein n=1 Tax=Micromonospora profundi TaxID=1420889 RepID=UPI0036922CF7